MHSIPNSDGKTGPLCCECWGALRNNGNGGYVCIPRFHPWPTSSLVLLCSIGSSDRWVLGYEDTVPMTCDFEEAGVNRPHAPQQSSISTRTKRFHAHNTSPHVRVGLHSEGLSLADGLQFWLTLAWWSARAVGRGGRKDETLKALPESSSVVHFKSVFFWTQSCNQQV